MKTHQINLLWGIGNGMIRIEKIYILRKIYPPTPLIFEWEICYDEAVNNHRRKGGI